MKARSASTHVTAAALLVLSAAASLAAEPVSVTSLDDAGPGTLRDALGHANRQGGATVTFQVAGTIVVRSPLPALRAGATVVDGCTAPGVVELLRDPAVTTSFDGLRIESADNVIRCLAVRGFLRDGISVVGAGARNNLVESTTVTGSGDDGIGVAYGAEATLRRNVVTGSTNKGVLVFQGSAATVEGNTLAGNLDGVSVTSGSTATIEANAAENNGDNGISVKTGSRALIRGNVVRVNQGIGIWLRDPDTAAAVLANAVDRNGSHGVGVRSGVHAEVSDNVVTANGGAGLWMQAGADVALGDNTFDGNAKGDIKVAP